MMLRRVERLCKRGAYRVRARFPRTFNTSADSLAGYFIGPDKVYLASADQYGGMQAIIEGDRVLQCNHFYTIVGGLGGFNVLARLRRLESITFFDVNPYALEVCEFLIEVIRKAEDRNTLISLIYSRQFDSERYSFANQSSFYAMPIEPQWAERLRLAVGQRLFEVYKRIYWPYIQNPMEDQYDGASVHCTRLLVFHEAPIDGVMTYPFINRDDMRARRLTSINSFFFGKGWLCDETRYQRVRQHLMNCRTTLDERSIFDANPPTHSGLYASNVLDGTEKGFCSLIGRFMWTLWYGRRTQYLQLEYAFPVQRLIAVENVYGKGVHNPHQSCCELLDAHFDFNTQPFLEVIQPHVTEGMNYGFRFYVHQRPISGCDFLSDRFSTHDLPETIGIHILMGGGCPVDTWKQIVRKAVELGKTVFVFEHRKECTDWPEWDVNPDTLLPEKEIDEFLLSLDGGWRKYGAANLRGDNRDIRNICWILRRPQPV